MAVHVRPTSSGAGNAGAQVRDGERHALLLRLVGHAGGLLRVEDGVELVDQAEHHGGISRATWRQASQKKEKNMKMKNVPDVAVEAGCPQHLDHPRVVDPEPGSNRTSQPGGSSG